MKDVLWVDGGDCWIEKALPTRWEVCPVCEGRGTTVHPDIDKNGLSRADFEEDPDFADEYFSGLYDVPCWECGGRTTVEKVDWDQLTDDDAAAYREQLRDEAYARAEERAERLAGA